MKFSFFRKAVWVVCFVCVGSWPFGVGIELHLYLSIHDFVRKVMTSFEIFSQPTRLVGKPNQPVHWVRFSGTAVWVVFFVCVGSWSFGVGIALRLSCYIPNSMRKVLTSLRSFLNCPDRLGNQTSRFIGVGFPKWQFEYFALFILVLGHL